MYGALLTATRVTRGEEDAGRWDLLLVGRVRSADLVLRSLTVLAGAVVVVGAGVAAALVVAGTAATGAVLHGAGLAGLGLIFAALGGFAAQICRRSPRRALSRCRQWAAERVDEPPAPDPAAGIGHSVRSPPHNPAMDGLGFGCQRLLPAHQAARRLDH